MSAPTKIYLALVAVLALWMGVSTLVNARDSELVYTTDIGDLLGHSEKFTAMLRGRVNVRDADGEAISPPEGTLEVDVRARDASGTLGVRRIGTVQPDGVFEVLSLPYGRATVAVRVAGGETIWERDDIVVGGAGTLDPRIDPIDLGAGLVYFDVEVRGPSGAPATGGQLAWRKAGATTISDELTFDGLAPIGTDGHAKFFSTSSVVDGVCMVPGARTELFEELYSDSSIELGPGITIELIGVGELPDPDSWSLRVLLTPVRLEPAVQLNHQGFEQSDTPILAEIDSATGRALIPVARGGQYRIAWNALRDSRPRFRTIKMPLTDIIEIPGDPGLFQVKSTFPIDAFIREASKRRR